MKRLAVIAIIVASATGAHAALVLDQRQERVDLFSTGEGFLVGGDQEYVLAQTVTAGLDGRLARIEVPASCEGGALEVEIRDVTADDAPGSRVLASGSADASEFPPSASFAFGAIDIDHPVRMSAGDRFAIVLRNDSGRCGIGMGSWTDLYPRGRSVWRYAGTPAGVWLTTGGLADPIDAAFRTYVETGPDRRVHVEPCKVRGFGPTPIPDFVPLCRCVQDPGLRESRCGFFHPSMFLVRTVPSPIPPGQPFDVKWTLLALEPIEGVVEIDDILPPGFQDTKSPLVFFGQQVPVGESLTLSYEAVAGPKSGKFKIETNVSLSDGKNEPETGTMRTILRVDQQ